MSPIPVSPRRARAQRGWEILQFGLFAMFVMPLFLWMFINGMNLLRMIQCTQICRDIGSLYIHGVDFSTYAAQQLAARLAQGYGLQIGSSFAGNNAANDSNGGTAYVVLSEVMYVGTGSCSTLPAGTPCTNKNSYVFLQRLDFGNKSAQINGTTVTSALGNPTATVSSTGFVQNYLTDAGAVAPNFGNFLQTPLTDGQVIFIAEAWFSSTDLSFSAYPGGGIYARNFL